MKDAIEDVEEAGEGGSAAMNCGVQLDDGGPEGPKRADPRGGRSRRDNSEMDECNRTGRRISPHNVKKTMM